MGLKLGILIIEVNKKVNHSTSWIGGLEMVIISTKISQNSNFSEYKSKNYGQIPLVFGQEGGRGGGGKGGGFKLQNLLTDGYKGENHPISRVGD